MKRVKRRYLSLQLDIDHMPSENEFMNAIWNAVTRLFGEYGSSRASLALIDYDSANKLAIIRANLDTIAEVRTALATLTSLGEKNAVAVHVVAVSGTIKALHKKIRV